MLVRVVLLGEDEAARSRLESQLATRDVLVTTRRSRDFWNRPDQEPFDLAIVDHDDLPDDIEAAFRKVCALPERPELVVRDREARPGDTPALQAAGVFAILPGGLTDPQLAQALGKLIARRREALEVGLLADSTAQAPLTTDQFVSKSPAMHHALRMARRVAASDTSLLLLGETGSGKDWLARAVHGESPRTHAPFIAVNCGALPEHLLESELFGHVKGAFTGAVKNRRGYFELAHRGTLFLDEIGEMPQHLQVRLLRVLQDRTIRRLGSEEAFEVDVRIIAATHHDPMETMKSGSFRQDLYYRLAVVTLTVPSLRARREDVPDLVEFYRQKFVRKLARPEIRGTTAAAMRALLDYDWPGNIRELINVVERAVLLCEGAEISLADLPAEIGAPHRAAMGRAVGSRERPLTDSWLDLPIDKGRLAVVADFERRYLNHHLRRFHGHVGQTADHAGIDPRTLYSKMKQLGLSKEEFKHG